MVWPFSRPRIPEPSGSHAIGTTRYDVTGDSADPSAPAPAPRRVAVQAWYPAQPTTGERELYLDDVVRTALADLTHVPRFLLPRNPSRSVVNAAPVPGPHPVLIFNHGLGSFQKQSTSLLEELASHGYVVLSVGHPHESLVVQYPDGAIVKLSPDLPAWREVTAGLKNLEETGRQVEPLLQRARAAKDCAALREAMTALAAHPSYAALVPLLASWAHDTRLVIETLPRVNSGELTAPLRGLLDAERLGVFGHSLGGMVAGHLAMNDRRVRAGMSFDGAQLPLPGAGYSLAAPFCFVYADATTVGEVTLTNEGMNDALALTGPAGSCSVTFRGAGHLNFTDMNNVSMMARALGRIDRVEMARLLRGVTVGFFDHHLKGKPLTFPTSDVLRVRFGQP